MKNLIRFPFGKYTACVAVIFFAMAGISSVFLCYPLWAGDNRASEIAGKKVAGSPSKGVLLNFEDADIRTIARFVGKLTGRNFVVDESVKGLVTIVSSKPIPLKKIMDVFHVILESHGLATLVREDVTEIVPAKNASKRNIPTLGFKQGTAAGERFVTRLFQLTSANSDKIREAVRPLITEGGEIISYADAGILIVTDFQSNISI